MEPRRHCVAHERRTVQTDDIDGPSLVLGSSRHRGDGARPPPLFRPAGAIAGGWTFWVGGTSAVLLLQQIREQLGVTQLRDVAHSLRRGEGERVRVRQTTLLSRRNAAHTCKRCSSRRSLSVQTTTSGERGAVVGSVSTCSRAHAVKSCPPLSPRAGPHASRPWRRPPRAKSHSRAQRRGEAETRLPASSRAFSMMILSLSASGEVVLVM